MSMKCPYLMQCSYADICKERVDGKVPFKCSLTCVDFIPVACPGAFSLNFDGLTTQKSWYKASFLQLLSIGLLYM